MVSIKKVLDMFLKLCYNSKRIYKGVDEECADTQTVREMAVGASHRAGICVCSFRAGRKKAFFASRTSP